MDLSAAARPRRRTARLLAVVAALTAVAGTAVLSGAAQAEVPDEFGTADAPVVSGLVLNGPAVSVSSTGSVYRATVEVRTTNPPVTVHVEATEQVSGGVVAHDTTAVLTTTGWQTVRLEFTSTAARAQLGVNVAAASDQPVEVGQTSITRIGGPAGSTLTNGCALSERGVPDCGTLFGAAHGSNTDPTSFEAAQGATFGIRRTYFQSSQVSGAVNIAEADAAAGRVSWMTFKLPYSWTEMTAGKGDAWARDLVNKLDAVDGVVWLGFHHEPEKDGAIGDWVAMQRRLAGIVHAESSDIAFSLVLTGWNQFYGPTEYRMENVWPGDGLVDVLAFDIYNLYGTPSNGSISTTSTNLGTQYFPQIAAFAAAHDVAWGLAETGYSNEAFAYDKAWLGRTYDQMVAAGGVAMSYFNTDLNSVGSWPLGTGAKADQFGAVLRRAPVLD